MTDKTKTSGKVNGEDSPLKDIEGALDQSLEKMRQDLKLDGLLVVAIREREGGYDAVIASEGEAKHLSTRLVLEVGPRHLEKFLEEAAQFANIGQVCKHIFEKSKKESDSDKAAG